MKTKFGRSINFTFTYTGETEADPGPSDAGTEQESAGLLDVDRYQQKRATRQVRRRQLPEDHAEV